MSIVIAAAQFPGSAARGHRRDRVTGQGPGRHFPALRIAPFVASAWLSGLEAENIAVWLAAGPM
jgi:hypothetical protein